MASQPRLCAFSGNLSRSRRIRLGVAVGAAGLGVVLAMGCAPPPGIVETRADEFTGQTSHVLDHPLTSEPPITGVARFLVVSADAGARPVTATISVWSESWRYLRCDRVDALADGAPVALGESGRDHGDVTSSGNVIEYVRVEVPWASLVQMASAHEVRIRVCNDVYRGDATFTAALGELARRMYAAEPTAAPATP